MFYQRGLLVLVLAALLAGPAMAETFTALARQDTAESARSVAEYWTSERLRNARPMPLPVPSTSALAPEAWAEESLQGEAGQAVVGEDGVPPRVHVQPDLNALLYEPTGEDAAWPDQVLLDGVIRDSADVVDLHPRDVGSVKGQFTSSRLIPLSADRSYPYRAVGKLFFTTPDGDFICSAAVLRARVLLTAGHCVHGGTGNDPGFFSNFMFVPAFRDGAAPYGTWDWEYVVVPNAWVNGGGVFPNAADYAMFELSDRVISGQTRRIGDVTGFFGYQTSSLFPNHVHMLGFPANLDTARKMHQITANSLRRASPNCVDYGSDMRGGSSGGPWVQNFGAKATGQTGGTNTGLNRIVGVTSYGPVAVGPLFQGSSIPDSRFVSLLNSVCAHRAGNCT